MAIIFHRIIKDNIFPAESFNLFISDNAIEFSKDGIAVVYAPNGVGKTSLAKVLEEGAGKNLSFEYDGKADDPNTFYVIEDQNSRNIIKGDAGEFFVGAKIRDIKYHEQWLDKRYEDIRLGLKKFLDDRNIKLPDIILLMYADVEMRSSVNMYRILPTVLSRGRSRNIPISRI